VPRSLAEGKIAGLKEVKVFILIIIKSLRCSTTKLFCPFIKLYFSYHQHPDLLCLIVFGEFTLA